MSPKQLHEYLTHASVKRKKMFEPRLKSIIEGHITYKR